MGNKFIDQYSYLHFASGIIAYFWNINLIKWFLIHLSFELTENTNTGVNFINKYLFFWPGGKPYSDYPINILGDNISAIFGWLSAYHLDKIGSKKKWYQKHLK